MLFENIKFIASTQMPYIGYEDKGKFGNSSQHFKTWLLIFTHTENLAFCYSSNINSHILKST